MPTQGLESNLVQRILRQFSVGDVRLFRRNAGMGWAGKAERYTTTRTVVIRPEDVVIRNARPLHAGDEGMADIDGCISVVITPEMVGQRVAVAVYVEAKAPRGMVRPTQYAFIQLMQRMGARAGICRSEDDVRKVLTGE